MSQNIGKDLSLHNNSEKHRSDMIIWQCRPWFASTLSSWEQSALVQSGSALHTRI